MPDDVDLFERTIELPRASPSDWALLDEVFDLFRPYADDDGRLEIQAMDSRGRVKRATVAATREGVEQRDEEPHETRVEVWGPRETYLVLIVWSSQAAFGRFISLDEPSVTHVLTRVEEIFARHAEPLAREEPASVGSMSATPSVALSPSIAPPPVGEANWLTRFLFHTGAQPRWERLLAIPLVGALLALLVVIFRSG